MVSAITVGFIKNKPTEAQGKNLPTAKPPPHGLQFFFTKFVDG